MSDLCGMDAEFLSRPFDYVSSPLRALPDSQRVLFAPGTGLGLGDQFLCLPLMQRLRRHYPWASIEVWTEFTEFWELFSDANVRVVPAARHRRLGLIERLRSFAFDVVVAGFFPECLHDLAISSCPTVFCAGTDLCHYRAFYAFRGACREIPLVQLHRSVSEQQRFLGLFDDFGLRDDTPDVPALRRSGAWHRAPIAQPRVLLHPGTAKAYKQWPAAKWRALAHTLAVDGARVLVSAGVSDADEQLARDVQGPEDRVAVLPRMSLQAFLKQMQASDILLSSDTFVPHAAAWFGGPQSLTLYGPTDPLRFCPRTTTNMFLSPLEVGPGEVAAAIHTLLTLREGGVPAVATPGMAESLIHAAGALAHFVDPEHVDMSRHAERAARWQCLVSSYRERIRPQHRRLLVGDDAMVERCERFAATSSWPIALEYLRGAAAVRGAVLALQCQEPMSTTGALAG